MRCACAHLHRLTNPLIQVGCLAKRRVYDLREVNRVAWFADRAAGEKQRTDDSRQKHDPLRVDLPAVAIRHPLHQQIGQVLDDSV